MGVLGHTSSAELDPPAGKGSARAEVKELEPFPNRVIFIADFGLFFFVLSEGANAVELYVDEVVPYDAGLRE